MPERHKDIVINETQQALMRAIVTSLVDKAASCKRYAMPRPITTIVYVDKNSFKELIDLKYKLFEI